MATISTESMDRIFNFIQKISRGSKEITIRNIDTIINEERNNLSDLKFALEMRYRFLQNSNQSSIEYDYKSFLENIRNDSVAENLQEKLDTLRLFLLISSPNAPLLLCSDCFQNLENTENNAIKELEIMNVALGVINLEKDGKELMCEQNTRRLINIAFKFPTEDVRNLIVNCILKKLDPSGLSFNSLKLLWERIQETSDYNFLYSLADYYFSNAVFEICNQETYWTFIQKGIVSKQHKTRKQSMHLLKRAVDIIAGKLSCILNVEMWSHFFMLMETFEEKQVQQATPTFHLLKNIRPMNYSWRACVYQRMLEHCNSEVNFKALTELFQEDEADVKNIVFKIFESFFVALNNIENYSFKENEDRPVMCQHLEHFFKILDDQSLNKFIEKSLQSNWTIVPLIYITYEIKKLNDNGRTVYVPFNLLKTFITTISEVTNRLYRRAIASNFIKFITMMPRDKFTIYEINELIAIFSADKCFKRGTVSWTNITSWLSSKSVEVPLDDRRINAHTLLLLFDSGSINIRNLKAILKFKLQYFHTRNYYNLLLCPFLNFFNEFLSIEDNSLAKKYILSIFDQKEMKNIIDYMKWTIYNTTNFTTLSTISLHVQFFRLLFKNKDEISILECISDIHQWIIENWGGQLLKQYFQILLLIVIRYDITNGLFKETSNTIYEKLKQPLEPNDDLLSSILKTKVPDVARFAYYQVLHDINKRNIWERNRSDSEYLPYILKTVETGENVKSTMYMIYELFLRFCNQGETHLAEIVSIIDICWELSIHDSSYVCQFVKTFFNRFVYEDRNKKYFILPFVKYGKLIIKQGQKCFEVLNVFIFNLLSAVDYLDEDYFGAVCNILIETVIFGPRPACDQRYASDAYEFILAKDEYSLAEEWKQWSGEILLTTENLQGCNYNRCIWIRMRSIKILLRLLERDKSNTFISEFFEKFLLQSNAEHKQECLGDSSFHHLKNRMLQVLLTIQPYLNGEQNETLLKWLCKSWCSQSHHQSSIWHQQAWLGIRILHEYPSLMFILDDCLINATEVTNLPSFIFIIYHWTKLNKSEQTLDKAFTILPLAMGQNLNAKLYARTAIKLLYESAEENFADVTNKYSALYRTAVNGLNEENATKNINHLSDDFLFVHFHPLKHYSFETVFKDLPRLTNCPDGSINIENYNFSGIYNIRIPLQSENDLLKIKKTLQ